VTAPTPLLDFFKRGEVPKDVRLLAAQGALAPRALEQLSILVLLLEDSDEVIRKTADETISKIPEAALKSFLARSDIPAALREYFILRGIEPADPALESESPLVDSAPEVEDEVAAGATDEERRLSVTQQLNKMGFTQRLRAAAKGSREMRAILIRDANKMIAATVLSSPKLSEQEVESFSRMTNVGEEVLRIIGNNRAWIKNYGVVLGLTKNPKTPLAMSMNFMSRLNDRDLQMLSNDRNVPEPLRVAARKKVVSATSKK
jgi:hypothetical protein